MQLLRALALQTLLTLSVYFSLPSQALTDTLRVRLFESHPGIKEITIDGPFEISSGSSRVLNSGTYSVRPAGSSVRIDRGTTFGEPLLRTNCLQIHGLNNKPVHLRLFGKVRNYNGSIDIASLTSKDGKSVELIAHNTVPTTDYVESVVGSETQPGTPVEAIKAQAVLCLTLLAKHKVSAEFGDSTQEEAYLGSDYRRKGQEAAIKSVWGERLTYDGKPITVFFHSTCAGKTSAGIDVFGDAVRSMPYLQSVECQFCSPSPFWKETTTSVPWSKVRAQFGDRVPEILSLDSAKRPRFVSVAKIPGVKKGSLLSGYQFWILFGQKFGWDKAPGLRFTLARQGENLTLKSTGAGHGVGMCQWGAAEQARAGKTYRQILKYYFPGTVLTAP